MSPSKIQLSKDELDLVKNSAWILTKNLIIEKLVIGLGALSERMLAHLATMDLHFNEILKKTGPRISRGERYHGLPWLVLDYPRIFGKEDIFAIRCFFWWGRHCSISIQCRGKFMPELKNGIFRQADHLAKSGYFLATTGDEWVHDLESDPHLSMVLMSKSELNTKLQNAEFIRLGKIVPLDQWSITEEKLFDGFTDLIETISLADF